MNDLDQTVDEPGRESGAPVPARIPPRTSVATASRKSSAKAASAWSTSPTTSSCSGRSPSRCRTPARRTPRDAEAYLTEARTVANLDHPNIVPVYDVGSTERFPCFVVSKYIDGADLATTAQAIPLIAARSRGTGGDGGRSVAPRPQARAGASGHQARQHPAGQERQAVRRGFRAGFAGTGCGQRAALRRDACLHESRTGPWRRAPSRWPQRHFQPGRGASTNCWPDASRFVRTRKRNCWSR